MYDINWRSNWIENAETQTDSKCIGVVSSSQMSNGASSIGCVDFERHKYSLPVKYVGGANETGVQTQITRTNHLFFCIIYHHLTLRYESQFRQSLIHAAIRKPHHWYNEFNRKTVMQEKRKRSAGTVWMICHRIHCTAVIISNEYTSIPECLCVMLNE